MGQEEPPWGFQTTKMITKCEIHKNWTELCNIGPYFSFSQKGKLWIIKNFPSATPLSVVSFPNHHDCADAASFLRARL